MKKPPTHVPATYWLSLDGEQVNGPYSMPQILAMHKMTPIAPETPMKLEGTESWGKAADWLPAAPARSSKKNSPVAESRQSIPPWMLLAGLAVAVVAVVVYFFVLE